MKYIKSISVIGFLMIGISSCSTKTAKQGRMIPKDAAIVMVINTKSLASKLSWDEIQQTSWFKEMHSDSTHNDWNKKMLENPEMSGIDTKGDQVFFVLKQGDNGQAVYEGDLKDSKAFEAFNKKMDSSAVPSKEGDLHILTIHNKAVLGWNEQKFIYVANAPMNNHSMENMDDSLQQMAPTTGGTEKLIPVCKMLFGLNSSNSLYKDEKFAGLVTEDGDVHFWVNIEQLSKGSASMGMIGMINMDKMMEGNFLTSTLSFDNGAIIIKHKAYASKELTDIIKKYNGGTVNADMLKNFPPTLAVAMALHFKPEALTELIKLTGMEGLINAGMAKLGMTLDDFTKANKGDILFALSDLNIPAFGSFPKNDTPVSHKSPDAMNLVFAVSVADKDAFNKLIEATKKISAGKNNGVPLVYINSGQYFIVGNNQQSIDHFLAGNKTVPAFTDKVKDHPGFFYIDFQTIFKAIEPTISDTTKAKLIALNKATWQNMYVYGGEYSDGAITATTEINFIDKNTNSLKQINKLLDQLYIVKKEMKKEDWSRYYSDSTAMPGGDTNH